MLKQVIVVGGGLAGLSAAHTVIEQGGSVVLIEKNGFLGGNSTKATSGINGAPTISQIQKGILDTVEEFERDTALSATKNKSENIHPLGHTLCDQSSESLDWLMKRFKVDLSQVARLGGHSKPRTHRGSQRFPGMAITNTLIKELEQIEKDSKGKIAKIVLNSRMTGLITEGDKVIGAKYEKDSKEISEYGVVILATGGYSADRGDDSLIAQYRPDLLKLPTTNAPQTTGDGVKVAIDIGADVIDMACVQVHPTGFIQRSNPNASTKFLAAEALRGVGGILLDGNGNRFCDELGRRDYVTEKMNQNKPPFTLILNSKSSKEMQWHCKHYEQRGVMKQCKNGNEVALEMNISPSQLKTTFDLYNKVANKGTDEYGKKYFDNTPFDMNDHFYIGQVCPVVHYTMGGLQVSIEGEILRNKKPIPGLFGTGEVLGGIHGQNRLGGNSLLDCVVFGRISGRNSVKYILKNALNETKFTALNRINILRNQLACSMNLKKFKAEEIAKHDKENDCWITLFDKVYNVTQFLNAHPGGKDSILLYAGKDATEAFDLIHEDSMLKQMPENAFIGMLDK